MQSSASAHPAATDGGHESDYLFVEVTVEFFSVFQEGSAFFFPFWQLSSGSLQSGYFFIVCLLLVLELLGPLQENSSVFS